MATVRSTRDLQLALPGVRVKSVKVYTHHGLAGGQIDPSSVSSTPIIKGSVNVSGYGQRTGFVNKSADGAWTTLLDVPITNVDNDEGVVATINAILYGGSQSATTRDPNLEIAAAQFRIRLLSGTTVLQTITLGIQQLGAGQTAPLALNRIFNAHGTSATSLTVQLQWFASTTQAGYSLTELSLKADQAKR